MSSALHLRQNCELHNPGSRHSGKEGFAACLWDGGAIGPFPGTGLLPITGDDKTAWAAVLMALGNAACLELHLQVVLLPRSGKPFLHGPS